MLHILFFILKIVGIILAVILGILLILVCIVLFVPLCYKGEAQSSGTLEDIQAHGQIIWLFGLVKAVVDFRNKSPDFYIRIVWKKLGGRAEESMQEEEEAEYEDKKEHEEYGKEYETALEKKEVSGQNSGSKEPERSEEMLEKHLEDDEGYEEYKNICEEKSGIPEKTGKDAPEVYEEEPEKNKRSSKRKRKKKISFSGKIKEKFLGVLSKIRQTIEKFKCTIQKLYDKIKETSEKKDKLAAFITDQTHVNALGKGKKELLKLLGHLPPKQLQADIHYGFEDPSLTGKILAGFGILYPFLGDHVRITPDFQERVLEGSLKVRGRIYVIHLAALAVRMILSRDVRRTIKDVRNFQL